MIAKYLEIINSAVIKTISFVKLFGYFKIYIFIFCPSVVKLCPTLQPHAVTAARQASLSFTVSWSLLRFVMSIKSVMLSNHLILGYPLLLSPSLILSLKL